MRSRSVHHPALEYLHFDLRLLDRRKVSRVFDDHELRSWHFLIQSLMSSRYGALVFPAPQDQGRATNLVEVLKSCCDRD